MCVCVCVNRYSVFIFITMVRSFDGFDCFQSIRYVFWPNIRCSFFFFGSPFLLYSHFGYPLISFIPTYSIMVHRSFVSKRGVCFRIPNRSIQCSMTELKCQIPKIPYAAREYPIHLKFCNGLKHEIRFIFIIP